MGNYPEDGSQFQRRNSSQQQWPPQPQRPRYGDQWQPERYDPDVHTERATRQNEWPSQPPARAGQPQYPYRQQLSPNVPAPSHRPPRRRKSRAPLIIGSVLGSLAVLAAIFVVIPLALASHGKPQTCAQQYAHWKTGPADAIAKRIEGPDDAALTKASGNDDIPATDAAIVKLGSDAKGLEADPMPACADPAGYWPSILGKLAASGDNAGSTPGLGGLIAAEAPLKQVKPLEAKLDAELARTAGVKTVA